MTFVILQSCCNDASCVAVCPVNCIHPTPDEPGFMSAEMLHIDPETCIDCGACVDECPVDAIRPEDELEDKHSVFLELNARYFDIHPTDGMPAAVGGTRRAKGALSELKVAIVGSGPAAFYSALELCSAGVQRVEMFEKLYVPYGLARFGVAPDHQSTKAVTDVFRSLGNKPNFGLNLGVEVGADLTHEELLRHHHAVLYAVGASQDRPLGIEGENLDGSYSATEFVAWYNGHPDHAHKKFDLTGSRAVIVGNGNVALDVARILLSDPDELARTDIAQHALEALRQSNVREVVVLGRRGPGQAAYTNPEILAMLDLPDVDVVVEPGEVAEDEITADILAAEDTEASVRTKIDLARGLATNSGQSSAKRLVLRYLVSPKRLVGTSRVEAIELSRNTLGFDDDRRIVSTTTDEVESVSTTLVFRSIGYRGQKVEGLPFDHSRGLVPNVSGRVRDPDTEDVVPGAYVAGWIKRGPSGVIGTNKKCASESVESLVADYLEGSLATPVGSTEMLTSLVSTRVPDVVGFAGWNRIDKAERAAGQLASRPRIKFIDAVSMKAASVEA
ncbi:4Fe-4S binding protein [Rhodococcus fascians]|nr:4Fe-4S binding protein [Rhodococcus fascians]MBY4140931.1 4Fe-4S binding protein [Rhodococcus fascians]MBY4219595.1 4Fe-4S binding protein [Rhodococcus fascians]MBY4221904.1 4Fe-4S binding protein [Rhodococcus fascians]MBY4233905.1 4Fe-4S binding protein [Rhodococcus fascians]